MKPRECSEWLSAVCADNPVIPVLTIEDVDNALPLGNALLAGGISVLEVTLRTEDALDVIQAMAAIPNCIVGAGTLLSSDDAKKAKEAGATFGVSPGSTPDLIRACCELDLPLLPGAVTPTEVMNLLNQGFNFLKFFPASAFGGQKTLAAIAGPLPQANFCPTGGVTLENAPSYLSLDSVVCVGGSWIAPISDVENRNWENIQANAQEATMTLSGQTDFTSC